MGSFFGPFWCLFATFFKQQEAQDNERSSVDHGAVLEALERALKATKAAFSEMADR